MSEGGGMDGRPRLDAEGWFKRGWAFHRAELWEEAIACYDRALELEPRSAPGWMNKGVALCFLGRFGDALTCFEEARRLGLPQAGELIALCRQKLSEQVDPPAAPPRALSVDRDTAGGGASADRPPDEIRLFISSTFHDLEAEREHLIKQVFPELRRLCRERGVAFTEIDLRWGITEEESRQGKVLKTCLDEIDRCRPYFIGMLGSRYGWTPSLDEVARNAELLEAHPWVHEAATYGLSATEIEIVHGVLRKPWQAEHAFFYFRDGGAALPGDAGAADGDAAKLAGLKERIRASRRPVREGVADVETLGRLVYDDLLGVIDRDYPPQSGVTPLARERRAHEAFAASRRRVYVADTALLQRLDAHVAGDEPALVVTGEAGAGKSALLANWSADYARRHRDAFVVAHYVSADSAGADSVGLMRRVMREIRSRYHSDEDVPTTAQEVERQFPAWLARVRGEKLVLLLDAVDQLVDDGASLAWLPARLPPQIRLVVAGLPGPALETLRGRGCRELTVRPLGADERRTLITSFLAEYRKALSGEQTARVSASPHCENPLFLRTVLEELRVFGSFKELDARIDFYLSAADLPSLFQRVLERFEDDFRADFVRELMPLLWATRRGLAESEFLEMTGRSRLELSTVLAALEYHLLRRDGLLTFSHEHLRQATAAKYLPQPNQQADAHARLAAYFQPQPASFRRDDELPWQLQQAGAWEQLRDCLADMSRTPMLGLFDGREYELLGYWNALGDRADMVAACREGLAAYEAQEPEADELYARYNRLGLLLRLSGHYGAAADVLQRSVSLTDRGDASDHHQVASALHNLALVQQAAGAYDEAEQLERRALAIRERHGADDPETATCLNVLGTLLKDKGDYVAAEPVLRRALAIRDRVHGPADPATATVANNLAVLLGAVGRYAQAHELLRRVVQISEQRLGTEHPDTGRALTNLGMLACQRGSLDAEPILRRGLEIHERALGPNHPDTAHSLEALATLFYERHDLAAAEGLVRRALAIHEQVLGPDHPATAASLDRLAGVLDERGDLDGAESLYRRALTAKERTHGPDHASTALTLSNLGYLLLKKGDDAAAEPLLERALAIRERALGPDHMGTAQSLTNLAGLRGLRGDHAGAEPLLRRAVEISERTPGPEHPQTALIIGQLAVTRHWQRDYAEAEALHRRALAIQEKTRPAHPDTANTLQALARLLARRGETTAARELWSRATRISEQTPGPGHPK
jgi:nephrocystin-3